MLEKFTVNKMQRSLVAAKTRPPRKEFLIALEPTLPCARKRPIVNRTHARIACVIALAH
jgi:hypothetical protein